MPREPDRYLPEGEDADAGAARPGARPWLGVRFLCAGAYLRVYRSAGAPEYRAVCPRCARCIRFAVGEGGTDDRFFEVSC